MAKVYMAGFGTTLSGSVTGAVEGLKEVAVGGLKVSMINSVKLDDENQVSTNYKGSVAEGPITGSAVFEKALYEAMNTAALEEDKETWTLTDKEGNTWVGSGWVSGVSNVRMGSGGENVFDFEITPETYWAFTKKT